MKNDIFFELSRVILAHEMTSTAKELCDYTKGRNFCGLCLCVSGAAEYRLASGDAVRVSSGDVVFLSSDAKYKVITNGDYHHYTVNFLLRCEPESELISSHGVTLLSGISKKRYRELFSEASSAWRTKAFGYEMRAAASVYLLLSEFFGDLYMKNADSFAYRRILPAKEYIDAHPAEDVKIEFLAELVRMSQTNFRREFLRHTGETPIRYRDMRKIAYAKDTLSSGFYTVAEAAVICGFSDPSYFARFFKKHTGMTPADFKREF